MVWGVAVSRGFASAQCARISAVQCKFWNWSGLGSCLMGAGECKMRGGGSTRQWCYACPISPGKGLWGPRLSILGPGPPRFPTCRSVRCPRLSILCPVPSRGRQTSPIGAHPPTYAVQTYHQCTGDQRWTAKLSQCKRLVRLHRTVQLFCSFHGANLKIRAQQARFPLSQLQPR